MTLTQINKAGLDELALDHVFTIGASGSNHYTFQGEGLNGTVNDPTLYLTRGKTYRFENGSGGHPIRIQSTSGASGTAYNTGVTNNAGSGTVIVEVQHDAPDVLYYQCTSHAAMNGILYITGALADGGVTTAKLADDAVTDAKLANSINSAISANTAKTSNATHTGDVTGSSSLTIASNAVTTAKIADEAVTLAKLPHGDGSSNGKFLRANNGADPSFETVSIPAGTTINNNADNRVITGSGTANTLEGEANLTFDGSNLGLNGDLVASNNATLYSSNGGSGVRAGISLSGSDQTLRFFTVNGGSERMRIDTSGKVGINETSPVNFLTISNTAGQTDSVGNLQIRYTGTNNAANSGLTVKNYRGTSQFMQWDGNGVRIGSRILTNSGAGNIYFTTGSDSVRAKLTGDGLILNGSDTAAANALDDYEEGTWSPSVSNATFSSIAAYYLKIGRMCTVWFRISGGGSYNGSNTVGVSSLPFTASSSGTHMVGSSEYYRIDFARDYTSHVTPYINHGSSTIYWLRNNSGGGSGNYLTANLFHSNAAITTTLTYQTT